MGVDLWTEGAVQTESVVSQASKSFEGSILQIEAITKEQAAEELAHQHQIARGISVIELSIEG